MREERTAITCAKCRKSILFEYDHDLGHGTSDGIKTKRYYYCLYLCKEIPDYFNIGCERGITKDGE